jgi:hypothetical protein
VFAAIAVGLHIVLLLVPLGGSEPVFRSTVIELDLVVSPQPPQPPDPEPENILEETVPSPPESEPEPLLARAPAPEPPVEEPPTRQAAARLVSAAILLEQVSALVLPEPREKIRTLGVAYVTALPANWTGTLLASFSGPFMEYFAPLEDEILDQWITPDGTRHAVIRTASGHTLCGSLEQWSPINPLYEPVPMYRSCGGGGRRKGR